MFRSISDESECSALEALKASARKGGISKSEAFVAYVRQARSVLVRDGLNKKIKHCLDKGVGKGALGFLPKQDGKPAAYFHPHFEHYAIHDRDSFYDFNPL